MLGVAGIRTVLSELVTWHQCHAAGEPQLQQNAAGFGTCRSHRVQSAGTACAPDFGRQRRPQGAGWQPSATGVAISDRNSSSVWSTTLTMVDSTAMSIRVHSQMSRLIPMCSCMQPERLSCRCQQQARHGSKKLHTRRSQDSISAAQPLSDGSQRVAQATIQLQGAPCLHLLLVWAQQADVLPGCACSVSSAER